MSMIPKSRDNWLIGIRAHHANPMTAIHLPMLTQIQDIAGSLEMIPFTTIFESVGYPLEKGIKTIRLKILDIFEGVRYPFEKSRVSEGFSEKKCSCVSVPMAREFFTSRKT